MRGIENHRTRDAKASGALVAASCLFEEPPHHAELSCGVPAEALAVSADFKIDDLGTERHLRVPDVTRSKTAATPSLSSPSRQESSAMPSVWIRSKMSAIFVLGDVRSIRGTGGGKDLQKVCRDFLPDGRLRIAFENMQIAISADQALGNLPRSPELTG